MYVKIETQRLDYFRTRRDEIRAEFYFRTRQDEIRVEL